MLKVGARASPLSKAQYQEVLLELRQFHPDVTLEPVYLETRGDKDQKTSLRSMGKTDFFTFELDELLLKGGCRIAIHSAKDLPEPLPLGLQLVALTKGVDSADSLVLRDGDSLDALASGAIIATSSERREVLVKELRNDLIFVDLRGNIQQRIAKLHTGEADGVVVAEAALIRLGLTHLNRIKLPGDTVPLQGRLAVLARSFDEEMEKLFSCIHLKIEENL